jgi:hypothetical protein
MRGTNSLRISDLSDLLSSRLGPLGAVRGFEGTYGDASGSVASPYLRLLRGPRGVPHPLRYVLLITALFDSFTSFLSAYRDEETRKDGGPAAKVALHGLTAEPDPKHQALSQAINAGTSVREAAGLAGVAVATAMAWAAEAGIRTPRRPKHFTADKRSLAISRLMRGQDKARVAEATGVSIQTITLLLRTEPGLHDSWHSAIQERRRRLARSAWERTAKKLLSPTAKALRTLQPAAFAWLYRNDRAWLEEFAANLTSAPRSNNSAVRWDQRDTGLSQAVLEVANKIAERTSAHRIQLSALCDEIPELKGRLSKLDRLPLTRDAIKRATSRRSR